MVQNVNRLLTHQELKWSGVAREGILAFADMDISFGDSAAKDFAAYYELHDFVKVERASKDNRKIYSLPKQDEIPF